MSTVYLKFFLLISLSFDFVYADSTAYSELKSYNIDSRRITVSGVSSGAFMASQLGVAYSKLISGFGSVAGGIYWCAEGIKERAVGECMKSPSLISSEKYIKKIKSLSQKKLIDSPANLRNNKYYIFSGTEDVIIKPVASDKLYEMMKAFTSEKNIVFEKSIKASHGLPTVNQGTACESASIPWLLNCKYDTAGIILKTMYGKLKNKSSMIESNLTMFGQKEFGDNTTPLYEHGWIYVPQNCRDKKKCKLHIALHGCQQNADFVQDKFVKHAGYNEWAEANNIIILYPQSAKLAPDNPYACWDWYGFTGPEYMTHNGQQLKAIKAMIDRLRK